MAMLHVATWIESSADSGSIPFVIDRHDGTADYGFAASKWVIDLYYWMLRGRADGSIPDEHFHRMLGLLLGYGVAAIRDHKEEAPVRLFALSGAAEVSELVSTERQADEI